jgi:hypothetical protein
MNFNETLGSQDIPYDIHKVRTQSFFTNLRMNGFKSKVSSVKLISQILLLENEILELDLGFISKLTYNKTRSIKLRLNSFVKPLFKLLSFHLRSLNLLTLFRRLSLNGVNRLKLMDLLETFSLSFLEIILIRDYHII